jgi:hypothetical protein
VLKLNVVLDLELSSQTLVLGEKLLDEKPAASPQQAACSATGRPNTKNFREKDCSACDGAFHPAKAEMPACRSFGSR